MTFIFAPIPRGRISLPGRRALWLALAACALAAAFLAPGAEASRIVYVCAPQLCAVDPDTGAGSTITSDGASSPYSHPSISRDGGRLAAARGVDVMVGDYGASLTERWAGSRDINGVAIAPSGAGVAESHSYVETRYGCPLTGGCLELVDRSAAAFTPALGAPDLTYLGGGGVGFLGAGSLLSSYYTKSEDLHKICLVAVPAAPGAACEPRIASGAALSSPAGSPDGKLIAVTVAAPSGASSVELFEAASGAPVRRLAENAGSPAFSPDGSEVAVAGADGWIQVIPTAGGKPRRLVQGVSPTWGGGEGPGPGLVSKRLSLRKGRIALRMRCGGPSACRGTVRIRKGKLTVGGRAYRVEPGKRVTLKLKPTARGARRIAASGKHRVVVELKPRGGKRITEKLTLRR